MKESNKKKSIQTLPEGIWESSPTDSKKDDKENLLTTDLQGNGYPVEIPDSLDKQSK